MSNIRIIQQDITTMAVDAIVNAANSTMLGGGGVDGAIHRVAGPELLAACKEVKPVDGVRCPVGGARITAAGRLKARYVIHTVGPRYYQDKDPRSLLSSAYRSSLELARENGCQSLAFPALSCGVYGYPFKEAAQVALAVCGDAGYQPLQITFCLFGDEIYRVWSRIYEDIQKS